MNRKTDQFATSISLRASDGTPGHPAPTSQAYLAAGAEQALFRFDLRRSLQMHRRLALGFAICGLVLAAACLVRYWHVYTAQALVYIQPTPAAVLEGAAPMHWPYNYDPATYDSYVAQQMLSMKHPDVLAGALHKLEPGTFQQSGESDASAAERLKGDIEVARVETSYQVSITAHASNPDTAAAMANAVAASYIEDTKHEQKAGDAERLAMLKDERDRVKKELDDDRAEQATLNAQLGVAAIGPVAPEHYDTDIATIHDELVKARADHDEAAARLTTMNAGGGANSPAMDAEAETLITVDPGLGSLKSALLQRRAALVSQMANLTPNHPLYKQDQAELAKIDASLESSTQQMRTKAAARIEALLKTDLDRTSGLEARLNVQLAEMTRAAASATPKLQRSSDLASDIERLQNRFSTVDEQLQNQTLEDSAPGTAHLAEPAVAPLYPSVSGVIRNAIVLLVLFSFLGIAAAVVAHKMDPLIYVASDVEHLLGFAPMAQLPDFNEVPDEVAGEHLMRLATGIEYACKESGMRSCVLTGTGPGAGVSTLAARLKDALGLLGRNVVLVNASEIRQTDGSEAHSTRSTALVQPGNGAAQPSPEVRPQESLVLTDAAPLTVSAEAEYMARCADCTLLVIESGVTTRQQLRNAAGALQRLNPATVGLVLNRVSLAKADPAFRRTVDDVARHLRSQNRAPARPTVRKLHLDDPQNAISEPKAAAIQNTTFTQFAFSMAASQERPPAQDRAAAAQVQPRAESPVQPHAAAAIAQPLASAPAMWSEVQPVPTQPHVVEAKLPTRWQSEPVDSELPPEIEPLSKQMTKSAPEKTFVALPEPAVAEFPREVEPASKLTTGPAPETVLVTKPTAVRSSMWREDQVTPKPHASPVILTGRRASPAVAAPVPHPPHVEEVPWWLTETPAHSVVRTAGSRVPRVGSWYTDATSANSAGPAAADAVQVEQENAAQETQHLSGLKGILFALGIKEIGKLRAFGKNGNGGSEHSSVDREQEPDQPVPVGVFTATIAPVAETVSVTEPAPIAAPVQAEPAPASTHGSVPHWVIAEPEFLPPTVDKVENGKETRTRSRPSDRKERGEAFDHVQILPSRRGQYKRKS